MKRIALALALVSSASLAHAAVGFFATAQLSDGTSVHVSRPQKDTIRYVVDFELFPSRTTYNPGCGVFLSRHEALDLGDLYEWAASAESPQQFEESVALAGGGEVVVSRSAVSDTIESRLDDGTNLTGISTQCFPQMTDADAELVGGWLLTAASNGAFAL